MKTIEHTRAIQGEKVTTHLEHNGIGLGYLVAGEVYKTTGSYYAVNAKNDVFKMVSFDRDNGNGYFNKCRNLTGWKI